MSRILEIKDLCVSYGVGAIPTLKKISMQIEYGEIVALIGANGAGKSTLMKAIIGVVKSQSGSIKFKSVNIFGKKSHEIIAAGISHSPEGRQVFADMTVLDNLWLGAYSKKMSTIQMNKKVDEIYAIFPIIKERKNQMAGTMSGGEQQMLAIGRALMSSPELLLLDEPSLGVSPVVTQKIFEVLVDLNKRKKTTILLAEQNATMALEIASRGYVLETGEVVHENLSAQLMANDSIREAYLGY